MLLQLAHFCLCLTAVLALCLCVPGISKKRAGILIALLLLGFIGLYIGAPKADLTPSSQEVSLQDAIRKAIDENE